MVSTSINGKLYFELYQTGGDKLISVYLILKSSREKRKSIINPIIKSGKTIKYYRLLKLITGLSEPTLKKYIPKLESLGICHFTDNGGFYLMGNNKTKKTFKSKKFFKITVSTLSETVINVFAVRLRNNYEKQLKAIKKTVILINLNAKAKNQSFETNKEYRKYESLVRKGFDFKKLTTRENAVLSNCSFGLLKSGIRDKKMVGHYWKKKMVEKKLITTKRDFQFIANMSYKDYLILKAQTYNKKLMYLNGRIYEELVSIYSFAN